MRIRTAGQEGEETVIKRANGAKYTDGEECHAELITFTFTPSIKRTHWIVRAARCDATIFLRSVGSREQ